MNLKDKRFYRTVGLEPNSLVIRISSGHQP